MKEIEILVYYNRLKMKEIEILVYYNRLKMIKPSFFVRSKDQNPGVRISACHFH